MLTQVGRTTYLLRKGIMGNAVKEQAEKWVRIKEVADHLDVSVSYLNKQVLYGDIPVHRIGRNLRFRLSEIDTWVSNGASGCYA